MNLKRLLLPVALSIGALFTGTNKAAAQVSGYTFAQSTGTYTALTSPTVFVSASSSNSLDSYVDSTGTFPFTFSFGGAAYTKCYVSANGFLTFGAAPSSGTSTPISTAISGAQGVVSAWGRDINAIVNLTSGSTTYNGEMSWKTIGTSPNRQVVLQWKDFRPTYTTSTTIAYAFDFQIILEETTNKVYVKYGGLLGAIIGTSTYASTAQIGLKGSSTTDFNNRLNTTTTAFTSSTAGTAASSTQAFSTVAATPGMPSSGYTYTWTPGGCFGPSNVTTSNLTTASVTLNWTAPTPVPASGYEYEVRTSGAAGSGATGLAASGTTTSTVTSAAITGLTTSTSYTVYVRGNCGGTSFSPWTAAVNFTTLCNPVTIFPYTDTFSSSGLPSCWSASNANSGTYNWTGTDADGSHGVSAPQSGSGFLYLYAYLASTAGNPYLLNSRSYTLNSTAKQLQYYYYLGSSGYNGTTGATGSDPYPLMVLATINGGTSYDTLFTHSTANTTFGTSNATSFWTQNTIQLPASYANQTVQFRFVSKSNYGSGFLDQALDEVTVMNVPSCQPPTGIAISGITSNGATATWTAPPVPPSNGYQYEVRSSGTAGSGTTGLAASGSTAAGIATATFTGLVSTTTYSVFVRSNCGTANGFSTWVPASGFTTLCLPTTTFPYTDTFSSVGLPTCWSTSSGTGTTYNWTGTASDASYGAGAPQSGSGFLYLYVYLASSTYNPYILNSRQYTLNSTPKQLQYYYYLGNNGYKGTSGASGLDPYPLMVLATINGGTSYDTLFNHSAANSTFATSSASSFWTLNTIPLPAAYANQTVQFRYVSKSNYGSGYVDQALDEVTVMDAPLCTNPVVNLGNDTAVCAGSSLTLNAGNAGAAYLWSTGATTQTIAVAAAGTYSVRVTVTGGCIGRDTVMVTVNPLPVVSLGNDTGICVGNTVTFNAGNAGASYMWSTGATTQTIMASAAGTYSVRVTNASGCIGRDTVVLTSNPLPVVALGADTTICAGNAVTLNAGNAGAAYLWSTGATTQTIMASVAGTYSVRVTNAGGCIGRDTVMISVNPRPTVALGNDTTFCVGSSITLNAGNAGSTYLWSTGATTQTVAVSATGSYSVRVTNANGCIGRDTVVVTVSPLPVVNLGPDTAFCVGSSYTLNAGNTGSTYLWSTGATTQTITVSTDDEYAVQVTNATGCVGYDTVYVGASPTPTPNLGNDTGFCAGGSVTLNAGFGDAYLWSTGATTQSITVSTIGTYSVRVTNAGGCIGRDTIVVTVAPSPAVALGANRNFCAGGSAILDAGNPGASYLWSTGATSKTINVAGSGTFSVRVTNGTGCVGRDTVNVTVRQKAVAGKIQVTGQSPTFTFKSIDPQNDSLRGWIFGDGTSAMNNAPTTIAHTFAQAGTYKVKFYAANSCGSDTATTTIVVTTLSLKNAVPEGAITLFPNPAANYFLVQNSSAQKMKSVTVLNVLGAVVQELKVDNPKEQRIAIDGLAAGSYLVRITLDGTTVIRRLQITQ